jgi:hypothetical protein
MSCGKPGKRSPGLGILWEKSVLLRIHLRRAGAIVAGGLSVLTALFAWQKPFREYPGIEYSHYPVPADKDTRTEWTFARLMYTPVGRYYGGVEFFRSWKEGGSNWTMDYPRSDRHLSRAVQRLTRIDVRQAEEPIDLDDGDVYDWPWLYGVEVGHWSLTDPQAKTLREFLLRGGFFMCDDFHGSVEWATFIESMNKVFPDRPIVDLDSASPIFHTIYDLDRRYQVPGALYLETGLTYEKGETGKTPHWRAIYDDHGRVMVAMCHNMDLGDSWEHADNPQYPAQFSDLGIRIGIDYIVYAFTH